MYLWNCILCSMQWCEKNQTVRWNILNLLKFLDWLWSSSFFGGAKRLRLRDNYQKPIREYKVTELFTVLPWKERRLNVIFMAPWFMNKLNQPWIIPNFTFLCLRTSSMIMTSTLRKNRLILHFKSKNINKKYRAKKSKAQLIF